MLYIEENMEQRLLFLIIFVRKNLLITKPTNKKKLRMGVFVWSTMHSNTQTHYANDINKHGNFPQLSSRGHSLTNNGQCQVLFLYS